jgi:hypothetical protein
MTPCTQFFDVLGLYDRRNEIVHSGHLRDITWRRENGVLALGTAPSVTQGGAGLRGASGAPGSGCQVGVCADRGHLGCQSAGRAPKTCGQASLRHRRTVSRLRSASSATLRSIRAWESAPGETCETLNRLRVGWARLASCVADKAPSRRDRQTPRSPVQRCWPVEPSLTNWLDTG